MVTLSISFVTKSVILEQVCHLFVVFWYFKMHETHQHVSSNTAYRIDDTRNVRSN